MQIIPDVSAPSAPAGSPETGVCMPTSLLTDAGTVDTAGYSQALGSPTMQLCFLCITQTPDIRFTTHIQVFTVVNITYLISKLAICCAH